MTQVRTLSELEGVAIGIVSKQEPCTAYSIRMELQQSPSSHWRGSAGSIYPLLKRLESEGYIKSSNDVADGRGRKLLSVTKSGRKALKQWVQDLKGSNLISEVFDPVRSRVFFLDSLTHQEQLDFAKETLTALEAYLVTTRAHLDKRPASSDLVEHMGALGGYLNAESRVAWLKAMIHLLQKK